jgi:putative thiamine transport system permease protein
VVTSRVRFAWLPYLTLAIILGPVMAGLYGTLLPALGYFPITGHTDWTGQPFRDLFDWPGFPRAVTLSITTGVGATFISLLIVMLITAGWYGTRFFSALQRLLSPLLSVPHAAAAFGLAFLITPSGWIARLLSPWATGWAQPPDLLIVQDPAGLSLMAGLVAKEVPFLLLMTLAALPQVDADRSLTLSKTLGYGRVAAWIKTILPRIYRQIRLPVYVVLAYSMSVVDVAIILGPNTPPTLSVQILRWMSDPDITMRMQAAAGAVVQFGLVLLLLLMWRFGEVISARLGIGLVRAGGRHLFEGTLKTIGLLAGILCVLIVLLGLTGLFIWSFAGFWSFPDLLPDSFTLRTWMRHSGGLTEAAFETALIALTATSVALILTIGCLEAEHRFGLRLGQRGLLILYIPLLVPQTAFLPGLQTLLLQTGAATGRLPVILVHIIYVLPYVFLSLGDPFRTWDTRLANIASALQTSPNRILWKIRLPMLLTPVLIAFAVGIAVSVGQYLPTILIGGGRLQTLTTEAVALSAGGDRRAIGVYALAQTTAALIPFALATLLPLLLWRNRRGMS